MNKKFIKISISIFLFSFIFILGFSFILGNSKLYSDSNRLNFDSKGITMKYDGIEEDEYSYKIKIRIKNNTQYYAGLNNINLKFQSNNDGNPIFEGYDNELRKSFSKADVKDSDILSPYLDSNEEREFVFEVSRGLKFDKNIFDTNRVAISYNTNFYKYKLNKNLVAFSIWSKAGTEFIGNVDELFTLE